MRVRRCKPNDRCLHIPQWMFKEAGIDAPSPFKEFLGKTMGSECPISAPQTDSIILSRRHFRYFQREIYHLFKFWKPDINLRKRIKKLEDNVLYGGNWVREQIFGLDNLPLLCHYFFYYQRRLQRRVVSTLSGYGFMAKGEGNKIFQNNVSKKSSFENVLLEIAESNEEGILVAMSEDNTLVLIEETCRLMKEYVDVYAAGKMEYLAFQPGQRGGAGRGPVDDYNLLCDILGQLKANARDEGIEDVPGPVRKFLAKDIMAYNNAWKDDAFAPGFIPGWKPWLEKRRFVKPVQAMEGEEDWEFVSW